ncbi:COQ7 [Candida oxycetoniae]|uniref:5-demethoxyubiquinone hydroxylase, mitochondrial n=1 Tax=Candida oxycetoniae TaxID=497107 RepID=A0AAI9SU43_9ASCO|nr:COQ7 [Candida oxycetoniae]KAI3402906.2 COQ7 [Candida oxycetoniae]
MLSKISTMPSMPSMLPSISFRRFVSGAAAASSAVPNVLSPAHLAYLDRVIRVDQAGELGANYIYMGQYWVLANKYPHLKPVLKHMWEQEIHHHNTFNKLQTRKRVRPSLLTPLWKLGAVGMGAATAALSKEAAMACTVAVETVIGGHYNQQLRVLMNFDSDEVRQIMEKISQFRDEELEHLNTAIEHDAESAVPYMVITEGIKLICKGAIWAAERI